MKLKLILNLLLVLSISAFAQTSTQQSQTVPAWAKESPEQKWKRMEWWREARFGMFIHWGLYSVPARHEWVQSREKIPVEGYQKYFEAFNPDLYNPKDWAQKAKNAGMKYVVITAKHHEGFCLWDTKYSDFKATNTAAKRDLLKPLVDAFRAEGIRIGFYYSLIDWHHPEFTIDRAHPLRDNKDARSDKRDMSKYRTYMRNQLTELLTQFGQIDQLFLDYSYPGENGKGHADWDSEGLLRLVRKLQPQIIVDDRLDLYHTSWGWDYKTPEQFMPQEWPKVDGVKVPWETCQTFSGSWGYNRDEYTWKSPQQLTAMLSEVVSKGGNLLLNVGPTARGEFDSRANERLAAIGHWMKYNSRSIYGCTEAPPEFKKPDNCFLTYNPSTRRLYVHVLEWPFKSLHLKGYKGLVKYVQLLSDGSEIKFRENIAPGSHTTETTGDNDIMLELPVQKPEGAIPVIEIILK
ncbi:alpha-L-fucosidase [Desertivirga xinjiangensis]|uniref:alpha-L-fucosidase n=1 Tax=Desertivirga xinjiangensis TaxID=539206 RepID=UPI00210C7AAF|nr:alpha-L-fucosidase [Pedobacter xinjiangensis]